MINLDDYLSTQDELFNTNAQSWYFQFSGNNKPNTEKPFDVFVKVLHEVYFFIQDNLNKPFGCIEKINNVSEINGFNEFEKVILVDKILGVLSHHPEQEKQQKVFIQLVDFRHDLSPYTDDPEIQNPNWHFDFEAIKTELTTIEAPTEKHKFLMNLLFDYSAKANEIDELEHQFYESMGFVRWIKTELQRCEYEQKLKTTTTTPIVKALPPQPIVKQKPELNGKLITFKNSETIDKIHSELKGYFPNKEAELLKALQGEQLGEILLFPHNQNKFVEVFRRLKYNGFLLNTDTETKNWICTTFQFVKKGFAEPQPFNESSVWDNLNKGKGEPTKKERICITDWLPYKNPLQLTRETENEKL